MISLSWLFPYPIHAFNLPFFIYITYFLLWCANTLQVLPNFDVSIRGVAVLTLFSVIFMATIHWRRNRFQPQYLILIKWFSFANIVGPSIFLSVIFLPPLFGIEPFISQGFAFVAFLSIYLVMAIAVSRYKLFEFERWWSESLIWMSFGLLVIGMDLLIIFILDLSYQQASWLALAIMGWVYFPVRQLILNKLLLKNDQSLSTHLPYVVSVIAGSANQEQLVIGMEDCLRKIFDPIHLARIDQSTSNVELFNDGSQLIIPLPEQDKSIEVIYAGRGKRLFNSQDQKTAKALVDLFQHAIIANKAKEDGMKHERQRIRQDMHDSLGGYLLSIMHSKSDPQSALLARYAWNELRDILSALDERMSPLSVELLRWKSTLEKLVSSDRLIFNFLIDESVINSQIELSGFQRLNLGQILREAITNAYRHAQPNLISAYFEYKDTYLECTIKNNGASTLPEHWVAGRGIRHINSRTEQLNGSVEWALSDSACLIMTLRIPLSSPNSDNLN
jgi:signal transduction histidine kinase